MYTKGEWEVDGTLIMGNEETCVARVLKTYYPESQVDNANLIAAAPLLYEALGEVILMFDRGLTEDMIGRKTMDRAIKALSKAEGK